MRELLEVGIWLLIPAGLLPVLTAWVLRRYRSSGSQALRDRWHVSIVLAALGVFAAFLAANRLWGWGVDGEVTSLLFVLILLAVDIVSGRWLIAYWTGAFIERDHDELETSEQREDRKFGEERRDLRDAAVETAVEEAEAER